MDAISVPDKGVSAVRAHLLALGYPPVPLYPHDDRTVAPRDRGKRPYGASWSEKARESLITGEIDATPGETGIDTTGLQAVDLDVADPALANALVTLARTLLGDAPLRFRANSPRAALLYRAADPSTRKRSIVGTKLNSDDGKPMKLELLACGQQLAAFGHHHSGAALQWDRPLPAATDLPLIDEAAAAAFLEAAYPLIGKPRCAAGCPAERLPERSETVLGEHAGDHQALSQDDVRAALAVIGGGEDYDLWLRICAAVKHAAGGAPWGRSEFHAWSSRFANYDPPACDRKWREHLPRITGGTLIHLAHEADAGWLSPTLRQKLADPAARSNIPHVKPDRYCEEDEEFPMFSPLELMALREPEWIIPNVIAEQSLVVVYGPPKSLKTFFTLDLCFRLAQGRDLDDRPTAPRHIFYVTGEGQGGLLKRYQSWLQVNHLRLDDRPPLTFVTKIVNLLDPGSVDRFIAKMRLRAAADKIDIIALDTLSRAMAGKNENASEIMTAAVASAERIGQALRACVVLVHHTGKDAERGVIVHWTVQPIR